MGKMGISILLAIRKKGVKTVFDKSKGVSLIEVTAKIFYVLFHNRYAAIRNRRTRLNPEKNWI